MSEPCGRTDAHDAHTWTSTRGSYPPEKHEAHCPGKQESK